MITGKSVLAVIPARGGSKGLPQKNLQRLQQRSLMSWTIEAARASQYIDRVIVSSDNDAIIEESKRCGAEVPFVRPSILAQDDTPGIDPIVHAIQSVPGYDYVVVLQVTSPLRTQQDIDNCIGLCVDNQAPACVSVTEAAKHPYWMFTMTASQLCPLFPGQQTLGRQHLPTIFCLNGAVYVADIPWLLEQKCFVTPDTIGYTMPRERAIDIDTAYDLAMAECLLA